MTSEARGNFQPDWQQLQDSIDRPVGDPPPAVGRGIAYFYEGNYARAIEQFDAALKEDPQCILAISNRGTVYLHSHEYDAALADFNRLIELAPGKFDAHYKRARTLAQMGRRDQAIEDFRRALELAPADRTKRKLIEAQMRRLHRTRITTAAGIVLLISALLALISISVGVSTGRLEGAIPSALIFAVVATAGTAIVRRWPGWRIWAGAVAWLSIAAGVYGLQTYIFQIDRAFIRVGDSILLLFFPALLIGIGGFVLWAKRQEPSPARGGSRSDVTVAGAILLLIAGAILVGSSRSGFGKASDAMIVLSIVGLIGWAGAATFFRWRGWRTLSGIVAWIALIVCVVEPLTRFQPGLPFGYFLFSSDVLGAVFVGGFFVFVLWAKRQESKLAKTSWPARLILYCSG